MLECTLNGFGSIAEVVADIRNALEMRTRTGIQEVFHELEGVITLLTGLTGKVGCQSRQPFAVKVAGDCGILQRCLHLVGDLLVEAVYTAWLENKGRVACGLCHG
jgi:hypothetical protein